MAVIWVRYAHVHRARFRVAGGAACAGAHLREVRRVSRRPGVHAVYQGGAINQDEDDHDAREGRAALAARARL